MQKNILLFLLCSHFTFVGSEEWSEAIQLPDIPAVVKTVSEIMEHKFPTQEQKKHLYPKCAAVAQDDKENIFSHPENLCPNFLAARYEDSGVVPGDAMGAAGPEQFILGANGRVRSFNKFTGKSDGILDISTDHFFSPVSKGSFTTDSRIRYDRFSDRWFILITAISISPIRIVLAVSDKGIITPESKWSFYYFEPRQDKIPDYPTLGIDKHALYIGVNIMDKSGYYSSDGIVLPKESLLKGTLKAFAFQNIADPNPATYEGLVSPQGVDNFDADATEGYFIGIDGRPGRLMLRKIKDPGTHPMISQNIPITVPNSVSPLQVPQKGSYASGKFFLQGFDKRLGSTHVRNKRLYTAHNVGVDNNGNIETSTPTRDGCLWYEIALNEETPSVKQSGILFQRSHDNDKEERFYWMPGVMTNGVHTLVIACCTSGDKVFADAAFALRYSNDPPGKIRKPYRYTKSDVVYTLGFPPFKDLRWGEYSHASVDPNDDMTFWSIAAFSLASNSWGLEVVRIPPPPPAKVVSVTRNIDKEKTGEIALTITGEREEGSAYYDPGEGFDKRLKVEISGAKVLSTHWISPTQIDIMISNDKVDINAPLTVKITNPDGQSIETTQLV